MRAPQLALTPALTTTRSRGEHTLLGVERGSRGLCPEGAIRLSQGFNLFKKSCSCSSSLSIHLIVWQVRSPLMLRLAAHAALRSPNQWPPKSSTSTRTSTIEEVETQGKPWAKFSCPFGAEAPNRSTVGLRRTFIKAGTFTDACSPTGTNTGTGTTQSAQKVGALAQLSRLPLRNH
jgi:hypothetical protein